MAINLIKINEFPESIDTKNWMVVADSNGVSYKISIDNVKAELGIGALMQYRGSVVPSSAVQPAGDFFVTATQAGAYTEYGGVVVPANSFGVISRIDGVYTSSITELNTNAVLNTDIVNDLTTGGADKVLSAEQGVVLSDRLDSIVSDIGFIEYKAQENFALMLSDTDFDDNSVWTQGLINSSGALVVIPEWYATKNFIPVAEGSYTTNLFLENQSSLVTYDANYVKVNSYVTKGSTLGTVNWNFNISESEKYIKFGKRTNLESVQYFIKPLQTVRIPTSDVFLQPSVADTMYLKELPALEVELIASKDKPFLLNPSRTGFNYNALIDIKLVSGRIEDLKDINGDYLDLYLVFMRFMGYETTTVTSSIVQIAKKTGSTVGLNNVSVSTFSLVIQPDVNGLIFATLTPVANSKLSFTVIIDTTKLRKGIDTNVDLGGTIKLNTKYFATQLKELNPTKSIVCAGDSVTEFGNYPALMATILAANVSNIGVGGTRMAIHTTAGYDAFSFFKLADAFVSQDWTEQETAVQTLINTQGDDNTAILNRMKALDLSTVNYMTIFYGTNDFTGHNAIGDMVLTNKDTTTFAGAINYSIDKLLTEFPTLKLFFITPTHRFVDNGLTQDSDDVPVSGSYLIDYVDAIIKMANLNHIPVLDLYREGHFNKYNHTSLFVDGVHPNTAGYKMLAEMVSAFLESKV